VNISPNGLTPSVLNKSPQAHAYGSNQLLLPAIIFSPSEVKIPRAKSIKLKSKVGMARGPVLYRQKQSSRVLRPNWNAVGLSWVFGINMTSRASPKWWGRRRHLHWTHRGIPLRMAENYASYNYIFRLLLAARSAAAPADRAEDDKYEAVSVLTTVTWWAHIIIIIMIIVIVMKFVHEVQIRQRNPKIKMSLTPAFNRCARTFEVYRVAQKSKPPPIFQKIVLKIANEIRFLRKVKVWIKHCNTIRW